MQHPVFYCDSYDPKLGQHIPLNERRLRELTYEWWVFWHPMRLNYRYEAKFLTCEISDFTPYAHAQSNIQHIKYAEKTDN